MFRLTASAIAVLLASCGSSRSIHVEGPKNLTVLNAAPRPLIPREAESVEVFLASRPDRLLVEVGTWSRGGAPEATAETLRREAAVVGCDALLLSERVTTTPGTPSTTTYNPNYGKPGVGNNTYVTTSGGSPPAQQVQTVAVCAMYSDLEASHRPEPHPCNAPMDRVRRAKNEDKRAAIEDAPPECLRMFPPEIPVAEPPASSTPTRPPAGAPGT